MSFANYCLVMMRTHGNYRNIAFKNNPIIFLIRERSYFRKLIISSAHKSFTYVFATLLGVSLELGSFFQSPNASKNSQIF